MKLYKRTENGTTTHVSIREGLDEINHAMMDGKKDVREMFAGSTGARITYKDGRRVMLLKVDAPAETPAAAPVEDQDVHVVSFNGGKVHTQMNGSPHPWPLCRGGGMNQMLTQFTATKAPLSCKTCMTYAERRAARLAREAGNQ